MSNALKSTMEELEPQFEKATQNKLAITFGAAAELKTSIDKGAAIDAAILTAEVTDTLIKEGKKLTAAGRTDIARSGAGVAARKGAPKIDISTTEAFKHALLEAKSIAYVGAGATAPYILSLFDRLGIADQVKPKLKPQPTSNPAAKAVANGEAELGITQISREDPPLCGRRAGRTDTAGNPALHRLSGRSRGQHQGRRCRPGLDQVLDHAGRHRGAQGQGFEFGVEGTRAFREVGMKRNDFPASSRPKRRDPYAVSSRSVQSRIGCEVWVRRFGRDDLHAVAGRFNSA